MVAVVAEEEEENINKGSVKLEIHLITHNTFADRILSLSRRLMLTNIKLAFVRENPLDQPHRCNFSLRSGLAIPKLIFFWRIHVRVGWK